VADWIKWQTATVELGHFDEFYAEFSEDFACGDFIGGNAVWDSTAEEY
jgi:hypothetical protein